MTVAMTLCDSPEMGIRSQSSAKAGYWAEAPLTSREIEFDTSKNRCSFIFPNKRTPADALPDRVPVQNNTGATS